MQDTARQKEERRPHALLAKQEGLRLASKDGISAFGSGSLNGQLASAVGFPELGVVDFSEVLHHSELCAAGFAGRGLGFRTRL